jgi:hypothetical protein
VKHERIAAVAVAAKDDDYNPTENAFGINIAIAARPKTIQNHFVHSHHHLSKGRCN